jgi:serine-protein kinase ATM
LAKNKDDLIILYENLKNIRGFSEDCENSVIHKLINTLVLHTQSKDMQRSLEAAKCLGEIGPANLQTIVIREENNSLTYGKVKPFIIYKKRN